MKRFLNRTSFNLKTQNYKAFKVKMFFNFIVLRFPILIIIIRKYQVGNAWIGLHDTGKEKEFIWFKGNFRGGYKKWCPNQPDNHHNKEDCVELSANNHCLNDNE